MMNKQRAYILILILLTAGYIFVEMTKPKPLDLSDSFTNFDTKPLGSYILFEELSVLFPGKKIRLNEETIFTRRDEIWKGNWIFINSSFNFDKLEAELILEHVSQGGNTFMAGRFFQGLIADTLQLSSEYLPLYFRGMNGDSLWFADVTMYDLDKTWSIDSRFLRNGFNHYDTLNTEILGQIDGKVVNFIRIKFGEGYFYLHSNPELFGNYIVRESDYTDYVFGTLSYLPIEDTYWDEYYKAGKRVQTSPLRYIVSNEYLKWAWFIALWSVLLYFLFRSKRVQRVIPVQEPPKNTSIEFATTIAQLYLEKNSHKSIAEKKIRFFLEQLRQRLRVDTSELNETLFTTISERSGVNLDQIKDLFKVISNTQDSPKISETELVYLNQQIESFNRNSLR